MDKVYSLIVAWVCAAILLWPAGQTAWSQGGAGTAGEADSDELKENECPYVSRAHKIFGRVLAVVDKPIKRLPQLKLTRSSSGSEAPSAVASPEDRAIELNQRALEVCYEGVGPETGDVYLAFILGHELAHFANDHFWHDRALDMMRFADDSDRKKDIKNELQEAGAGKEQVRRVKEMQADCDGFLYAWMAGYDPREIVIPQGAPFIRRMEGTRSAKGGSGDDHPVPDQRIEFVQAYLKDVEADIHLFYWGVRLYQAGRYKDAIIFLEAFKDKYPCREVLSNLGLAHYQLAVEALSMIEPERALRFRLATVLDTESRASRHKGGDEAAEEMAKFEEHIDRAIGYFKEACRRDAMYLPARVNLSSALILKGDYYGALSATGEALGIHKDDPGALNNQAVARYLLGPSFNSDASEEAAAMLGSLIQRGLQTADASYNLGRIRLEKSGNIADAREAWARFLSIENKGEYARVVRRKLEPESTEPAAPPAFGEPSPVKLGRWSSKTDEQVKEWTSQSRKLPAGLTVELYSKEDAKALVVVGLTSTTVELVESKILNPGTIAELQSTYGAPVKISHTPSGQETYVYRGFAVDVKDGRASRVVHYKAGMQ